MVEISVGEYTRIIASLTQATQQAVFWKRYWYLTMVVFLIYIIFLYIILRKTQPDKETRNRIKELAKEKRLKQHTVANYILKSFFESYDRAIAQEMNEKNKTETYEEWKEQRMKEKAQEKLTD